MGTQEPTVSNLRVDETSDGLVYNPTRDFQGRDVNRSDTPETEIPDLQGRPDISVQCEKCGSFINLQALKEHRTYHSALAVLRYNRDQKPKSVDALLKRRNAVLRKMKSSASPEVPVTPQQVQKVNQAYEFLKSDLDGTFEELRQVKERIDTDVNGIALNCSPSCVLSIGVCASANERWKCYMEDTRAFQDCFGDDKNKCFFGLYDGHNGRFASEIAATEFHRILLNEIAKFDPHIRSTTALNLAESMDISHYKFERPNTTQSERVILYEESVGMIQQIIDLCETKYQDLIREKSASSSGKSETEKSDENMEDKPKKKHKEKTPYMKKMEHAFSKSYYLLDILLSYGKDECSRVRWSGCSATTLMIQDVSENEKKEGKVFGELADKNGSTNHHSDKGDGDSETESVASIELPREIGEIHLANSGNVRALLVRGNRTYRISKDHSPHNTKERNRVLREGGTFSESTKDCLVNGILPATRGLGNHGDKVLKKCIVVEPYTTCVPIDQYAQFIVLATKGVWDVFTDYEATSLLIKLLPGNHIPPPSVICSTLKPLLEELGNQEKFTPIHSSRQVSFSHSSRGHSDTSPVKEVEHPKSAGQRSILKTVEEEQTEGQRSSQGSEAKSDGSGVKSVKSENENIEEKGERRDRSGKAISHSTPTEGTKSRKTTGRKSDEVDLTTEIGSHVGSDSSEDEGSGNEGDIDTNVDNLSFASMSRISNYDGPLTRDQFCREFAKGMSEHLVQAALLAGAKDNITAMVILLPGCGL